MAARCLSYHQTTSGQPAIQALAMAPLRRLTLSVLFTIATNSYQTICTVSERTFNKRQHTNARHGVDFLLFTHYDTYHLCQIMKLLCYQHHLYLITVLLFQHLFQTQYLIFYST